MYIYKSDALNSHVIIVLQTLYERYQLIRAHMSRLYIYVLLNFREIFTLLK